MVCTLSSSSSSVTMYTVSSTSPSTRLQWLSYAYPRPLALILSMPLLPPLWSLHPPRGAGSSGARRRTCNLPRSSRSPRSLTKTFSSSERRTRSRGSEMGATGASVSAIASLDRGYSCVLSGEAGCWVGRGVAALGWLLGMVA
jgi:hypothetical protein